MGHTRGRAPANIRDRPAVSGGVAPAPADVVQGPGRAGAVPVRDPGLARADADLGRAAVDPGVVALGRAAVDPGVVALGQASAPDRAVEAPAPAVEAVSAEVVRRIANR